LNLSALKGDFYAAPKIIIDGGNALQEYKRPPALYY
jgi:hypothetical protein